MSKPNDLVQGTLDLLLLKILALEPLHGWAISLRLRSLSSEVLQVSEGSLYPALHKLEQEGWIKADWKQTENNRRAKFYSLTRLGRRQLETEAANWMRLSSAISQVVQLSEASGHAHGTLVVHRAAQVQIYFSPAAGGAGARRRASVPPRTQDRGRYCRGVVAGTGSG